jgi:hypothetical protein
MLRCAGPIGLYLHQPGDPTVERDCKVSLAPSAMHDGFQVSRGCQGRTHPYMTLRAAAVANLRSNQDSIKLPSEEKESG